MALACLTGRTAWAEPPAAERDALVAIYNATDGPHWTLVPGPGEMPWLSPGSICDWARVDCDEPARTEVQGLQLDNAGLVGTLPPQIGDLRKVSTLVFNRNRLSGPIPRELASTNVAIFLAEGATNGNNFSGGLEWISDLAAAANSGTRPALLQKVNLRFNALTGLLPDLRPLSTLVEFQVEGNQLSGSLPEFPDPCRLTHFNVTRNRLTGGLSSTVNRCAVLEELLLDQNEFSGPLPQDLGGLTTPTLPRLRFLNIGANDWTGELPTGISRMIELRKLQVGRSRFVGPLPDLTPLSRLELLSVESNGFQGPLTLAPSPTATAQLELAWNALSLQGSGPQAPFRATQTVAPTSVTASRLNATTILVRWTPIEFTGLDGYYEIRLLDRGTPATCGAAPCAPFLTRDKTASQAAITVPSATAVDVVTIHTATAPHGANRTSVVSPSAGPIEVVDASAGSPSVRVIEDILDLLESETKELTLVRTGPTQDRLVVRVTAVGKAKPRTDFLLSNNSVTWETNEGGAKRLAIEALRDADGSEGSESYRLEFRIDGVGSPDPVTVTKGLISERAEITNQGPFGSAGVHLASATDGQGNQVVVWVEDSSGGGQGVYAQSFSSGSAGRGKELLATAPFISIASIAPSAPEQFVVAWLEATGRGERGSTGSKAVKVKELGQRRSAQGENTSNRLSPSGVFIDATSLIAQEGRPSEPPLLIVWQRGAAFEARRVSATGRGVGGKFPLVRTASNPRSFHVAALPSGTGGYLAWVDGDSLFGCRFMASPNGCGVERIFEGNVSSFGLASDTQASIFLLTARNSIGEPTLTVLRKPPGAPGVSRTLATGTLFGTFEAPTIVRNTDGCEVSYVEVSAFGQSRLVTGRLSACGSGPGLSNVTSRPLARGSESRTLVTGPGCSSWLNSIFDEREGDAALDSSGCVADEVAPW
jgi:hypothetical protein